MKTLLNFLRQPHPVDVGWKYTLRTALIFGLFVAVFLALFQPFGTHEMSSPDALKNASAFGLVTFFAIVTLAAIGRLFPDFFKEEHWTLGRDLAWGSLNFFFVAGCNYAMLKGLYGLSTNLDFGSMLFATVLVGFFPYVFLLMLDHFRMQQKLVRSAAESESLLQKRDKDQPRSADHSMVEITGEGKEERLRFRSDEFRYARAAGNYVEVHLVQGEEEQKSVFRRSLSGLEEDLSDSPHLMRVHRAFLVNLQCVEHVNGNAQGYRLKLDAVEEQVPVSRKYVPAFRERMETWLRS